MTELNLRESVAEYIKEGRWFDVEKYFNNSDFSKQLGFSVSLQNIQAPRCEVLEVTNLHLGGIGQNYINGAMTSAMLDFVLGLTGLQYSDGGKFATCNLNIELAKPIKQGRFYAVATSVQRIDRFVFSEATVFDCDDEPCVYATGRLRIGIGS